MSSCIYLTFALASRVASASAAITLCICLGRLTSFSSTLSTLTPHGQVPSSNVSFGVKSECITIYIC